MSRAEPFIKVTRSCVASIENMELAFLGLKIDHPSVSLDGIETVNLSPKMHGEHVLVWPSALCLGLMWSAVMLTSKSLS